jgi:hypothetical protein
MLNRHIVRALPTVALVFAFASAGSVGAQAQTINEPEVEKGQRKLEAFSSFYSGLHGGAAGDIRDFHNVNYAYGLTEFWQVKGILAAQRPLHGDHRLSTAAVENTFEIQNAKKAGGVGYAWFTGISVAIDDEETNAVTFGPLVRLGAGATSLILNPLLEQTFGRNHEEGIAFLYGWQLKHQVRQGFTVGIEGFGRFPDIAGHGGPEEHKIGPLVTFEAPVADKRTIAFETGWLLGLNDTTPDHTIKFQITYTY